MTAFFRCVVLADDKSEPAAASVSTSWLPLKFDEVTKNYISVKFMATSTSHKNSNQALVGFHCTPLKNDGLVPTFDELHVAILTAEE